MRKLEPHWSDRSIKPLVRAFETLGWFLEKELEELHKLRQNPGSDLRPSVRELIQSVELLNREIGTIKDQDSVEHLRLKPVKLEHPDPEALDPGWATEWDLY